MAFKNIDWYERQLENPNLPPEKVEEYEREIERLADIEARAYAKSLERKQEEKKRLEEIRAQIQSGDANVIDVVGIPEFGDDYELSKEGDRFIVYSKVAMDTQENRHIHDTEKEAVSHYRKLIWDRLYSKYVRSGDYDSLKEI